MQLQQERIRGTSEVSLQSSLEHSLQTVGTKRKRPSDEADSADEAKDSQQEKILARRGRTTRRRVARELGDMKIDHSLDPSQQKAVNVEHAPPDATNDTTNDTVSTKDTEDVAMDRYKHMFGQVVSEEAKDTR